MSNSFAGWIIMAGIAICLIVSIWLAVVERREDRFAERNAQMQRAQRHRAVQDAVQHKINQDWRDAS